MLYRFRSPAGADVVMLGDTGATLLELLGREPGAQGLFKAGELPALIARLEAAVADDETRFQQSVEAARAAGEPAPKRSGISLRQRAWPLRELLQHSQREQVDVVWGV
ncbi:MAG: DUF1840 domain-containing protein [Roseateles depolymerans]|uniref:DUF1840 domain-containing protein n=1 Tax=Roseateles depolymerans TaxID=76731 RepID=A0A2W5DEA7_9BURK|nr:MAG: DUF1840 domain-containing protein [Roseateles depolymerans]PZR19418.1 MAG: DUF1840 domain-containing protein [Azospira oryzae]